jgi:hypothetical protein
MSEPVSGEFLPPIYYASEDGQFTVVTPGKCGDLQGKPEQSGNKGWMPAICGSVVGGEIAAAFTLDDKAQEQRWNDLREESPWEIVGWSLKAHDAVDQISTFLGPEHERRTGFEVRMYPSDSAAEAAIKVATLLEMEKDLPDSDRPVAEALRHGLLIGNPGEIVGPQLIT